MFATILLPLRGSPVGDVSMVEIKIPPLSINPIGMAVFIGISNNLSIFSRSIVKANLSNAARSAIKNDPELRLYYDRKAKEGKEHGVIMNAVKFKLITRVFAVVKRRTPFVKLRQAG
jgi:hypothetical protein